MWVYSLQPQRHDTHAARFSNVRVGSPTGNHAPTANLTAPANAATFTAPATSDS